MGLIYDKEINMDWEVISSWAQIGVIFFLFVVICNKFYPMIKRFYDNFKSLVSKRKQPTQS